CNDRIGADGVGRFRDSIRKRGCGSGRGHRSGAAAGNGGVARGQAIVVRATACRRSRRRLGRSRGAHRESRRHRRGGVMASKAKYACRWLLGALCLTPLVAAMAAPVAKPAAAASQAEAEPIIRAQLSPLESTVLSSRLAGKIDKVHVREGERFEKGQRLVTFDCSLHQAQLAKAQALED